MNNLEEELLVLKAKIERDNYLISINEVITLYQKGELILDDLLVWTTKQKSEYIQSLLLNLPQSPIYVIQDKAGTWYLVDGLQRLATILEFIGVLKERDEILPPLVLESTNQLSSLQGITWEDLSVTRKVIFKHTKFNTQIFLEDESRLSRAEILQLLNP